MRNYSISIYRPTKLIFKKQTQKTEQYDTDNIRVGLKVLKILKVLAEQGQYQYQPLYFFLVNVEQVLPLQDPYNPKGKKYVFVQENVKSNY